MTGTIEDEYLLGCFDLVVVRVVLVMSEMVLALWVVSGTALMALVALVALVMVSTSSHPPPSCEDFQVELGGDEALWSLFY